MSKPILSSLDFGSASRILNLPDGASAQEPATVAQLNAAIEGLAWKDNVKVSTQGNLNLASPGATIDGITMVTSDRFVARSQTAGLENGIYIWNGAAVAATRALDMNASAEFNEAVTTVDQGTNAGASFRQTVVNPTVGTTAIVWTTFGTTVGSATTGSAGIVRLATQTEVNTGTDATIAITPATLAATTLVPHKFAASFGDGSATQYDITHNLGTLDVEVTIFRNSDGVEVLCDVTHFSTTVTRLNFITAPTSNQYRCVVIG